MTGTSPAAADSVPAVRAAPLGDGPARTSTARTSIPATFWWSAWPTPISPAVQARGCSFDVAPVVPCQRFGVRARMVYGRHRGVSHRGSKRPWHA